MFLSTPQFSKSMIDTNLQRCRTCLAQDCKFLPLSSLSKASKKTLSLCDIFMITASIQIAPDDGFAQHACVQCVTSAEKAYLFRKQCEYSDKIWNDSTKGLKEPVTANNDSEMIEIKSVEIHGPNFESVKIETFNCKYCSVIFVDEASCSRHELAHTIQPKNIIVRNYVVYGCRECSVDVKTAEDFVEHCRKSHRESVEKLYYRCRLCAGDFADFAQLTRHVSARHYRKEKTVSIGLKRFLRADIWPQPCDHCELLLSSHKNKIAHLNQRHGDLKNFGCSKCGKTFFFLSSLFRHVAMHEETKIHCCQVCKERFPSHSDLMEHIKIHGGEKLQLPQSSAGLQVCYFCTVSFKSLKEKMAHLNQEHPQFKTFRCNRCRKSFFKKNQMKRHEKLHEEASKHKCEDCGESFPSSSDLNVHIKSHNREKSFKCDKCAECFTDLALWYAHELNHKQENCFECTVCDKKFKTSETLRKHVGRHVAGPKYLCHLCPGQFKDSGGLKRHLSAHSNERPYACKVCRKGFYRKFYLKQHTLTHTGEKPHVCTVCKKGFTQAHSLYSHKVRFHKDGTVKF